MSNIQEVFGQFAVKLADGPVLFPTREEAEAALAKFSVAAEAQAQAAAYCDHHGIEGKNRVGKTNVIVSYLEFVALGDVAPTTETTEAVETETVSEF